MMPTTRFLQPEHAGTQRRPALAQGARDRASDYVKLKGGGGKAILRWVSFKMPNEQLIEPLYSATEVLTYEGQLTLDSKEKADKWRGMLSAQTVSLLSASTSSLQAAASISGAETAILATTKAPCTICLNLDDLFTVK